MSELMKLLKDNLKYAMAKEMHIRKNPANGEHMLVMQKELFDTCIAQKTVSRAIISMCPEIGKKPNDVTDDDVIKLLKKYIGQEKERNVYQFGYLKEADIDGKSGPEVKKLVADTIRECGDALTSTVIQIAQEYLPVQATEEEIKSWIEKNIDFSQFKNKMQAMGPTLKHFKGADGNFVKKILLSM